MVSMKMKRILYFRLFCRMCMNMSVCVCVCALIYMRICTVCTCMHNRCVCKSIHECMRKSNSTLYFPS